MCEGEFALLRLYAVNIIRRRLAAIGVGKRINAERWCGVYIAIETVRNILELHGQNVVGALWIDTTIVTTTRQWHIHIGPA